MRQQQQQHMQHVQVPGRHLAATVSTVAGGAPPGSTTDELIRARRNENEKRRLSKLKATVQSLRRELQRQNCISRGKRKQPTKQEILDAALCRLQQLWEENAHLKRGLAVSSAHTSEASDDDGEEVPPSACSPPPPPPGAAASAAAATIEPLLLGAEGESGPENGSPFEGGFEFMTYSLLGNDDLPPALDLNNLV